MSEQRQGSLCPHPEAVGTRWGDHISEQRQQELQRVLDAWEAPGADHSDRVGPFAGMPLTGADVFWLAIRAQAGPGGDRTKAEALLRSGHFGERLNIQLAVLHLEGANLNNAHLEGGSFFQAKLQGASLRAAHLEDAELPMAHLEEGLLRDAHLQGANLTGVYLEGADLSAAQLQRVSLRSAQLQRATLRWADLEGAALSAAQLQQAILDQAQLSGADLRDTRMDSETVLTRAVLDATTYLGDIQWGGIGVVNLTQLDWSPLQRIGEETQLQQDATPFQYEAAGRAYRQLAVQLRAQGMSEAADRFSFRSHVVHRKALHGRRHLGSWVGSWLLDVVAGYGYRPLRSLLTYVMVVAGFALAYYALGTSVHPALTPVAALVFSITAIHGRGLLLSEIVTLRQPLTALAAGEAILGSLIELTFIVMYVQRFAARSA